MPDRALPDAHRLTPAETARTLEVDPRAGLDAAEARRRLEAVGSNELSRPSPPSLPGLIFEAATEPFILLLLAAGGLAVAFGETRDGLLVMVGLIPIVAADVITEYRAERALDELRSAAAPVAHVRRDGAVTTVAAADLVPGDVVLVRSGDIVPADLRLIDATGIALDRSALTGESVPEPGAVAADAPDTPLAARRSIAPSGTNVVRGSGEGIVVATGTATEVGRIAGRLTAPVSRRSPLQRELDRLVRILLVIAVILIVITAGAGFVRGEPAGANVLAGISAAIAAIPEEPPILLAVILGLGAHRLLKKGVLVRRLSAEETLGAVDLILTDKTGTLTENRLELTDVLVPSATGADGALGDGALEDREGDGGDGRLEGSARTAVVADALRAEDDAWRASGDGPARGSFARALAADLEAGDAAPRLDPADLLASGPPTELRPYATTRHRSGDGVMVQVLGAPEAVLSACPTIGGDDRTGWLDLVARHAARGGRLLLLASGWEGEELRPRAVLAFADPLRPTARESLAAAGEAGIQTIVVTGDHPVTARAIAEAAGLPTDLAISGSELADWPDDRLDRELPALDVVARATPDHKLRLVEAGRRSGRIVAVTGDGVNDAPALHAGDVAVAMGSGSAVAKGASDLVLGDDSFATLLYAIRDGRRIVANVQKGLVFLVSTHIALLGFVLVATLLGWSQPLLPIQILWLELFIDVATSVSFEREAEEPGAMTRPPRRRDEPLLPVSLILRITLAGGLSVAGALAVLAWHDGGFEHARWVAFTALVVAQVVRAYANRSLTQPIWRLPPNRFLLAAGFVVVLAQASIPLLPPIAEMFRATPLDLGDWAIVAVIAFVPAIAAQLIRARGATWVG